MSIPSSKVSSAVRLVSVGGSTRGPVARGLTSSSSTSPLAVHTPVRKVREETWPSPMPRSDIRMRVSPCATPAWSGCSTTLGLNRAADSKEYSSLKYPPISRACLGEALVRSATPSISS